MPDHVPQYDLPARYRIVFMGTLPESWSDRLGGMMISTRVQADGEPVTIMSGWLPDQAALLGVLTTLYGLHFPLLSVEHVSWRPEASSAGNG